MTLCRGEALEILFGQRVAMTKGRNKVVVWSMPRRDFLGSGTLLLPSPLATLLNAHFEYKRNLILILEYVLYHLRLISPILKLRELSRLTPTFLSDSPAVIQFIDVVSCLLT